MQMQQQQRLQESSPLAFLILASLVDESKRATTLHEAVMQAGGLLIEPGAFSRVVARMERRGGTRATRAGKDCAGIRSPIWECWLYRPMNEAIRNNMSEVLMDRGERSA